MNLDQIFHQRIYGKDTPWRDHPCGSGSTMANTAKIRAALPDLVARLNIESILDCACGDYSWMSTIEWNVRYVGMDCVTALIESNREKYPGTEFVIGNAAESELPRTQCVFARDVLIHWPNHMVQQFLDNVRNSGVEYLIASTYPLLSNSDCELGQFRPVSLEIAPFNLGPALEYLDDSTNEPQGPQRRSMGVWRLK